MPAERPQCPPGAPEGREGNDSQESRRAPFGCVAVCAYVVMCWGSPLRLRFFSSLNLSHLMVRKTPGVALHVGLSGNGRNQRSIGVPGRGRRKQASGTICATPSFPASEPSLMNSGLSFLERGCRPTQAQLLSRGL